MKHKFLILGFLLALAWLLLANQIPRTVPSADARAPSAAIITERVSVASNGAQGNAASGYNLFSRGRPAISADGRYVAFVSWASNLVPNDTNGVEDVFVHDRLTGQTERVSVASDGTQANNVSGYPSISPDGRYVAFVSYATNLVTIYVSDAYVYLHDRQTRQTTLISTMFNGCPARGGSYEPSISSDGRIAFASDSNYLVGTYYCNPSNPCACTCTANCNPCTSCRALYLHEPGVNQKTRVATQSYSSGPSFDNLAISADGKFVAFKTGSALVPEDTNGINDIYVYDRLLGQSSRASVAWDGAQSPGGADVASISADGRYVVFVSASTNLVPNDTNGFADIFVRDRQSNTTTRASIASDGTQANASSTRPAISATGRYVVFESTASNLVPDDTAGWTDIFVHDRDADGNGIFDEPGAVSTTRVSVTYTGAQALYGGSSYAAISGDGSCVTFVSAATNLVENDTNGVIDVFVRGIEAVFSLYLPLILR
jgi:Tol biopolymer transport system component